jgi:hypothetical protein
MQRFQNAAITVTRFAGIDAEKKMIAFELGALEEDSLKLASFPSLPQQSAKVWKWSQIIKNL